MTWITRPAAKVAGIAGLGLGGGSAGLFGILAVHKPALILPATLLAGLTVITAGMARIVESRYEHRRQIIEAEHNGRTAEIKAEADALVQLLKASSDVLTSQKMTDARVKILHAGLDPATRDRVPEMLRLQNIDVNLPKDRRLPSPALAKLLAPPETRSTAGKPRRGPAGVVVPIRKDD